MAFSMAGWSCGRRGGSPAGAPPGWRCRQGSAAGSAPRRPRPAALHERGAGPPGADARQLLVERIDALLHPDLGVDQPLLDLRKRLLALVGSVIWSPPHRRGCRPPPEDDPLQVPSAWRSNTMIGMLLSMHRVSAVLSMTARPPWSEPRGTRGGRNGSRWVSDRVGGVECRRPGPP